MRAWCFIVELKFTIMTTGTCNLVISLTGGEKIKQAVLILFL